MHDNYLKTSIAKAGLDPHNLPASDPSKMNFGGGGATRAWRDIWGAGQGFGQIGQVSCAAELAVRLKEEHLAAKQEIAAP